MTKLNFLALALGFVAATGCYQVACGQTPDQPQDIVKAPSLVGVWVMKSGERAGEKTERIPSSIRVTQETFTIPAEEPGEEFVMAYTFDRAKSPSWIDFKITAGPAPEGKAQGIIKVEKDQMTLCYDPTGQERPKTFASSAENGYHVFVMQRSSSELSSKAIVGVWDIAAGTRAGVDVPKEQLSTEGGVTIDEKTITLPAGPEMVFVMSYQLNNKSTPMEIDMAIESGPARRSEGPRHRGNQRKRNHALLRFHGTNATGEV